MFCFLYKVLFICDFQSSPQPQKTVLPGYSGHRVQIIPSSEHSPVNLSPGRTSQEAQRWRPAACVTDTAAGKHALGCSLAGLASNRQPVQGQPWLWPLGLSAGEPSSPSGAESALGPCGGRLRVRWSFPLPRRSRRSQSW